MTPLGGVGDGSEFFSSVPKTDRQTDVTGSRGPSTLHTGGGGGGRERGEGRTSELLLLFRHSGVQGTKSA